MVCLLSLDSSLHESYVQNNRKLDELPKLAIDCRAFIPYNITGSFLSMLKLLSISPRHMSA